MQVARQRLELGPGLGIFELERTHADVSRPRDRRTDVGRQRVEARRGIRRVVPALPVAAEAREHGDLERAQPGCQRLTGRRDGLARLDRGHQRTIDLSGDLSFERAAPALSQVATQHHGWCSFAAAGGERELDGHGLAVEALEIDLTDPAAVAREREPAAEVIQVAGLRELEQPTPDDRVAEQILRGRVGVHDATLAIDEQHALIEAIERTRDGAPELGLGVGDDRALAGHQHFITVELGDSHTTAQRGPDRRRQLEVARERLPAPTLAQPEELATERLALVGPTDPHQERLALDLWPVHAQHLRERSIGREHDARRVEHGCRDRQTP